MASLALFAQMPKSRSIGTGHAETGKCLKVLLLLCDGSGFLLLIDILYGHNRSSQLSGQFELFSRAVSLLGGRGLLGNKDKFGQYSLSRCTLACRDSVHLFRRLGSNEIPMVRATFLWMPATLSSSRLKPLPATNLHMVPDRRASHHRRRGTGRGARGCHSAPACGP